MKYAAVALIVALSACSYQITTPEIIPQARPGAALGIGANASAVQVSDGDRPNADLQRFFANLLVSESSGSVRATAGQPLNLTANMRFDGENPQGSALFATFTLFIPPLAFVPETIEKKYDLSYELSNRQNQIVYRRTLPGSIEGSFNGYYIGRIFSNRDLLREEEKFAARNAARLVLDDVFAHAEVITTALARLRAETAPPDETPAPGAAPAAKTGEWWQTK